MPLTIVEPPPRDNNVDVPPTSLTTLDGQYSISNGKEPNALVPTDANASSSTLARKTTGFSHARACTSTQETHTHIAHKSTTPSSPPIHHYVLFTVFLAIDHNHYHHRWSLFTSSLSTSSSLFSCLGRLSLFDLRLLVSYNNDGQRCHESAKHCGGICKLAPYRCFDMPSLHNTSGLVFFFYSTHCRSP